MSAFQLFLTELPAVVLEPLLLREKLCPVIGSVIRRCPGIVPSGLTSPIISVLSGSIRNPLGMAIPGATMHVGAR